MATAFASGTPRSVEPTAAGSVVLTYEVLFGLDNGRWDTDLITVEITPGDSAATINGRVSSGITARATTLGLSVPKASITFVPFSKG